MQDYPSPQDELLTRSQIFFWSAFLFFLFVPFALSVFSPLPFALFAPLTGVGFFIGHKYLFSTWPCLRIPLPGLPQLVAVLIGLMLCSALWSFNPQASFERGLKAGSLIVASFSLLGVAQHCPWPVWRKYKLLFPLAALLVGGVTCVDILCGLPLFGAINPMPPGNLRGDYLNKNMSVFVMSLPVVLYLAWQSRSVLLFSALVALSAIVFATTASQACQLALLAMALAAFGCLSFLEKITLRAAFIALSFLLMLLPWVAPTLFDLLAAKIVASRSGVMTSASAALRLENWDFLSRRILENPLNGFGIDSTRFMTFDTERLYFHDDSILHPHSIVLQLWIEFGIFGVAWLLCLFVWFYALLLKLRTGSRHLAFLTFCGIMVFLLVSWSIWSSWLVALILYLSALCVLAAKTSTALSRS